VGATGGGRPEYRVRGIRTSYRVPVAHSYNPSYSGDRDHRTITVRNQLGQIVCEHPISKIPNTKKGGLVEWLKVRAMSSSPSTEERKKKKKKKRTCCCRPPGAAKLAKAFVYHGEKWARSRRNGCRERGLPRPREAGARTTPATGWRWKGPRTQYS
jgi:hypothetical protein